MEESLDICPECGSGAREVSRYSALESGYEKVLYLCSKQGCKHSGANLPFVKSVETLSLEKPITNRPAKKKKKPSKSENTLEDSFPPEVGKELISTNNNPTFVNQESESGPSEAVKKPPRKENGTEILSGKCPFLGRMGNEYLRSPVPGQEGYIRVLFVCENKDCEHGTSRFSFAKTLEGKTWALSIPLVIRKRNKAPDSGG